MSQEPKKRHSRGRQGKRRAAIHLKVSDPAHRMNNFNAMVLAEHEAKKAGKTVEPAESEE